ncbi:conserved hypothetical protein [Frankia sp. Hr75.2]|uniref:hypothetical protein n=1 Tax=Parafrankia soli TaxID=2599596 RepID=UPI0028A3889C|nr:conserved hypothetical protein [Frankia sp. Hr75.2]
MVLSDVTLAILDDGPFRGGTFVVRPGQTLTFGTSWLNPHTVVYRPTGEVIETAEGAAVVLRCEVIHEPSRAATDERNPRMIET